MRRVDDGPTPARPGRGDSAGDDPWLAFGDERTIAELAGRLPSVSINSEHDTARFRAALAGDRVGFVLLIAPPAGVDEIELVRAWLSPGRAAAVLSASDASALRLHALERGFADAVDSSADPEEVVGRLIIASRRRGGQISAGRVRTLRIPVADDAVLDLGARTLFKRGRPVVLRPREYALLEFLATHPRRTFTRRDLVGAVCRSPVASERVVDVYVCWLRAKIEDDARRPSLLVTVPGAGYRFDPAGRPI